MSKHGIGRTATTIAPIDGSTVITYHSTQVVSFNQQFINLRSGGYETVTTKRRMNEASSTFGLGFQVYQEKFYWYVTYKGKVYRFADRMTLDRTNGKVSTYDGDEIMPIAQLVDGLGVTRWEKLTA